MRGYPDNHELFLGNVLKKTPPPSGSLWPFLLCIGVLVLFKLLFFNQKEEIVAEGATAIYEVPYDPDLQRLEEEVRSRAAIKEVRDKLDGKRETKAPIVMPPPAAGKVRVAAAQIYSYRGRKLINRRRMQAYIEHAARLHVQIIVFPEAALSGYCDIDNWSFWALDPEKASAVADSSFFEDVRPAAEPANGENITFFRQLAQKHKLYIALPFIESVPAENKYYNSVSLIAPDGTTVLHYRKRRLLETIDTFWASEGDSRTPVSVMTPFGKIGVLIGSDIHATMPQLQAEQATLVLHASAFSGVNLDRWLNHKYAEMLAAGNCAAVLANWAMRYIPSWEGYGMSRILDRNGSKLAALGAQTEERLLIGDVAINN